MPGISGRLGLNFGKGKGNQFDAAGGGQQSDHGTLIVLVLAEAVFVGWLRFSFKKHFGG